MEEDEGDDGIIHFGFIFNYRKVSKIQIYCFMFQKILFLTPTYDFAVGAFSLIPFVSGKKYI